MLEQNDGFSMWYCLLLLICILEIKLQKGLCKQHDTMEGKMPAVKEDHEQKGQKPYKAAIRKQSDKTSLGIIESEYLLSR